MRKYAAVRLIWTTLSIGLFCFSAHSQKRLTGKVFSKADNEALPYASVATAGGKSIGVITDTSGKFSFWYPRKIRPGDSLVISALGHHPLKVALSQVESFGEFRLEGSVRLLENIVIVSTLKGNQSQFGYFRSWREWANPGEIGQVIQLPLNRVHLGSVQVKINHTYDTCFVKLHVRSVAPGGRPQADLIEPMIVPATIRYGILEFDLNWRLIKLPTDMVYVGFEVVSCGTPVSEIPSFCFVGSEEGENLYREKTDSPWIDGGNYTIYIRLIMR